MCACVEATLLNRKEKEKEKEGSVIRDWLRELMAERPWFADLVPDASSFFFLNTFFSSKKRKIGGLLSQTRFLVPHYPPIRAPTTLRQRQLFPNHSD